MAQTASSAGNDSALMEEDRTNNDIDSKYVGDTQKAVAIKLLMKQGIMLMHTRKTMHLMTGILILRTLELKNTHLFMPLCQSQRPMFG